MKTDDLRKLANLSKIYNYDYDGVRVSELHTHVIEAVDAGFAKFPDGRAQMKRRGERRTPGARDAPPDGQAADGSPADVVCRRM